MGALGLGLCPGSSITETAERDFCPVMCEGDRVGEGDGEELTAWAVGHVAPNEVSACHRASHQTVSRHAHFLNSTPCKRKGERAEKQPPICLKPVCVAGGESSAAISGVASEPMCQVLSHLLMYTMLPREYKSIKHEEWSLNIL